MNQEEIDWFIYKDIYLYSFLMWQSHKKKSNRWQFFFHEFKTYLLFNLLYKYYIKSRDLKQIHIPSSQLKSHRSKMITCP